MRQLVRKRAQDRCQRTVLSSRCEQLQVIADGKADIRLLFRIAGAKKCPAGQIAIPAQKPLGRPHIDRHAHGERLLRLQPAHKLHKGAPHLRVNARIEPQPDASAASGHRCALPGRAAP